MSDVPSGIEKQELAKLKQTEMKRTIVQINEIDTKEAIHEIYQRKHQLFDK